MEDYKLFENLDNSEEFETIRLSTEIGGKRVTAIIPKTSEIDNIMLAFEDEEDPEQVMITKLKDKFVIAIAQLINNAKYNGEYGKDDGEEDES